MSLIYAPSPPAHGPPVLSPPRAQRLHFAFYLVRHGHAERACGAQVHTAAGR